MGASRSVLLEPAPSHRPLRRTPNGGALLRAGTIRGAPRGPRKARRAPQPPPLLPAKGGCYEKKVPPLEKWRGGDPGFRAEIEAATRQRALQLNRPSPPKFYFGQERRPPPHDSRTRVLQSSSDGGRSTSDEALDWTPRQDISDDDEESCDEGPRRWGECVMPPAFRSAGRPRTGAAMGPRWGSAASIPLFRGDANWTLGGGGGMHRTTTAAAAFSFYSTEDRHYRGGGAPKSRSTRKQEEEEAAAVVRLARRVEEEVRRRRKVALQAQLRRLEEEEEEAYFPQEAPPWGMSRWHSSPALMHDAGGVEEEGDVYRRLMEVVREEEERQRARSGGASTSSCSSPLPRRRKRPPPPPPSKPKMTPML